MISSYSNKLVNETSPYLLQHANNPVNWYPWGDEALQKAKSENKVILVSIGYSACHWCHVMERESFENEATAAVMNASFINIKIDREERPDLDHIYMDAVQAMTGSGGWPLNVFLTPDAKPFYGGTYFPPLKAFNRASWTDVLNSVSHGWREKRSELETQAENLTAYLATSGNLSVKLGQDTNAANTPGVSMEQCGTVFENIMKNADPVWGGFGKAPKFPQTFSIQFLFKFYFYTKNPDALQQALLSLDKMLEGGIYDHVGGGLARYSTDTEWLAPHFEKMLYDNALLILALCDAFQLTANQKYSRAITQTIDFVLEEFSNGLGGFYAALDADSEGVEGKYYVWQKKEIDNILGGDAPLFCSFFDVSDQGNWEGQNILRVLNASEAFAAERNLEQQSFLAQMDGCLLQLKKARSKRVKPALDDKIILGWNALMMKAIARAGIVLKRQDYVSTAVENFKFIAQHFRAAESSTFPFYHTWKNGFAKYPAFLDDYAYFIDAVLQLYEANFDTALLHMAEECCKFVEAEFSDDEAIFFYFTNRSQTDIIVRKKEIYDGAIPSANAIMGQQLFRLGIFFDNPEWVERADKMLIAVSKAIVSYPTSFGVWAAVLLQQVKGIQEVSIVGANAHQIALELAGKYYFPDRIIMASLEENNEFPMLKDKKANADAVIFHCHNFSCKPPFFELESFLKAAKIK